MNKSKVVKEIFEWAEMLAVSVCAVLILMTVVVRHSPVTGHSMYPTLIGAPASLPDSLAAPAGQNDVLLISDLFYTPKSGDIVVTQANGHMENPLVKRVIAAEGQSLRIDFETWSVYVDGEKLDEPYVNKVDYPMNKQNYDEFMAQSCKVNEDGSYTIPDGYVFCMGDNRNGSADSRMEAIGLIDERLVVGRVLFRVFPFDRIGTVE